jgi:hypothetical protein
MSYYYTTMPPCGDRDMQHLRQNRTYDLNARGAGMPTLAEVLRGAKTIPLATLHQRLQDLMTAGSLRSDQAVALEVQARLAGCIG